MKINVSVIKLSRNSLRSNGDKVTDKFTLIVGVGQLDLFARGSTFTYLNNEYAVIKDINTEFTDDGLVSSVNVSVSKVDE